jgi:hypothetical protein
LEIQLKVRVFVIETDVKAFMQKKNNGNQTFPTHITAHIPHTLHYSVLRHSYKMRIFRAFCVSNGFHTRFIANSRQMEKNRQANLKNAAQ